MSALPDVHVPSLQEVMAMPVHEARSRCGYAYRELRRRLIAEPDEGERELLLRDMEEMGRRMRGFEGATS